VLIPSAIRTPWGTTDYVGSVAINAQISGANTIVSGQTGYFIVVLGYLLVASGDIEVAFESSGGLIVSGPYTVAQNGGNISTSASIGQFVCKKNEDLVLDLAAPIHVGGHVIFGLIKGGN
jgi:hypothetical protein